MIVPEILKFLFLIAVLTLIFFNILEWMASKGKKGEGSLKRAQMRETGSMRLARQASWGLCIMNGIYLLILLCAMFFSSVGIQNALSNFIRRPDNLISLLRDNWLFIAVFATLILFEFAIKPRVRK